MGRPAKEDRGLAAVLRVREAKEQEAQLGLVGCVADERRRQARAAEARACLGRLTLPVEQGGAAFAALQFALSATGDRITAADRDVETARAVTDRARADVVAATQQTRMVEMLLDRRGLARQAERQRAEARQLDEFAQGAWLRGRQS